MKKRDEQHDVAVRMVIEVALMATMFLFGWLTHGVFGH